jgi:hypothetical protein
MTSQNEVTKQRHTDHDLLHAALEVGTIGKVVGIEENLLARSLLHVTVSGTENKQFTNNDMSTRRYCNAAHNM